MKCRLCEFETDARRSMHGHLMFYHSDDYKRAGYNLDRLTIGAPDRKNDRPAAQRKRAEKAAPKPAGFRLISGSSDIEKEAIKQGFIYIDAEQNIYSAEEAKTEGWI